MLADVMECSGRPHRKLALVGAALSLAAVVLPNLEIGTVHADAIDDQRQRVTLLTDQLEDLERQSDILAEDYVVALDELDQADADVVEAEAAVAAKQAEVTALQGQLGQVAVQAFMGVGSSSFGPMFSDSADVNADLQRSELSRLTLNTGTADSDDLDRAVRELSDQQADLEAQRTAAEQQAEAVKSAQEATEASKSEYQQARAAAEEELGNLIQEEEERRARESWEKMQREQEAADARAAADAAAQAQAQAQAQTAQPANNTYSAPTGNNASSGNNASTSRSASSGNNASAAPAPAAPAPAPAPAAIPAASSRAGTAVNAAMSEQGTPYVYAAASPGVAFDCSGLTSWAWAQAGVYLPHQSAQQYASTAHVPSSAAQPGDLIFYYSPISHVGLYIGNGMMVHAPNSGSVVNVRAVNWSNVVGVGRPG